MRNKKQERAHGKKTQETTNAGGVLHVLACQLHLLAHDLLKVETVGTAWHETRI